MGLRMRRYAASGSASRLERFLLDATPPIIAAFVGLGVPA
jgi:hypothetical protein